jgi:hypothetical protein
LVSETRMKTPPNKITGANAGGPPRLPMRTRWTAHIAEFCRWLPIREPIHEYEAEHLQIPRRTLLPRPDGCG